MNFLTIIALFCVFAVTKADTTKEEVLEMFHTVSGECAAETGATEADIDIMVNHLPAKNMETKCLRACVMKKFELMNSDGKLDVTNLLKMSEMHTHGDPERIHVAEAVTSVCGSIDVPNDHCEAAELYKMCLQSEAMKYGVNICD